MNAAAAGAGAEVFADLQAEQERIEAMLGGLGDEQWRAPSAAAGWSVADVVLHLAQTEELVVATITGAESGATTFFGGGRGVDAAAESFVAAERAEPAVVFERWRVARRRALDALRGADPGRAVAWAAAPLRPATLATTRLAEHWAHALDVSDALGLVYEDHERLHHVAWLAHRTLPYAWSLAGEPAHDVYCELVGPTGARWRFGPEACESRVTGPLGDFCRVAAQRLAPSAGALVATGPHGAGALAVVRTYVA
ncbi:MAG TPA: maleylpyruvate isomerase family mycothiol-dependent enzyme [Acidimicrobiales bacterium]|nr:maleylpyruvate isomerase family mycothiol-dependent enzyme [Acidimicrobiales bacterium]